MLNEESEDFKDLKKVWFDQAHQVKSPDELKEFVELMQSYEHGYGTIVWAIVAALTATVSAIDHSPQGGITGFQAGAIGFSFLRKFLHLDGPIRLVKYNDMLYPQYASKFDNCISEDTWKYLQKEAASSLEESANHSAPKVREHWKSIVDGTVPFGYIVRD